MKLRYIVFATLLMIQNIVPSYAQNFNLNLNQERQEIANIITDSQIKKAKQDMLNALNKVKEPSQIRDTDNIIGFGTSMRNNMKLLPKEDRVPFLNYLRSQLGSDALISRTDWYFVIEESMAKPKFNQITASSEAKTLASRLYLSFFSDNPDVVDYLTRELREDIIKLVSQGEKDLLETFFNSYAEEAAKYGSMERTLNLFLSELTNNNLPLRMMDVSSVPSEILARNTIPAIMKHFSWDSFMQENTGVLLKDLFRTNTNIKFFLSNFTKLLEKSYELNVTSFEESNLLARLSILDNMAKVADPAYEEAKNQARFGIRGQRNFLRQRALQQEFGKLSKENAHTLSKILTKVPVSKLETSLPNAKGWIKSLSEWAMKSTKSGANKLRGIGPLIALVAIEEILRYYTDYNPSEVYLNLTDEITDAVATNNTVRLVYNTIYDDDFAQCFITYVEEGNLAEKDQLAFLETLDDFETAAFASYFQTSKDRLAEQDWQCFVLNENCVKSEA